MDFGTIVILLGVLFYALTCLAIFDIARKDFGGVHLKALWAFIALIPFLGPPVYFIAGFRRGIPKKTAANGP
jgi:4-amino-4-deoxy-L-arabinose transferase-like glycosyltransferase